MERCHCLSFANTGQEHEKTLDFIHNCDTHFNFNTVWIEAVISKEKRCWYKSKGCGL